MNHVWRSTLSNHKNINFKSYRILNSISPMFYLGCWSQEEEGVVQFGGAGGEKLVVEGF